MGSFWHAHTHSQYSVLDGMTPVDRLVSRAAKLGQPAMALTDHGVMSGSFQLYKSCRKHDMIPFPGLEAYIVDDVLDKNAGRFHLTMNAFTTEGYKWLVKLSSMSHERGRYHFKPRVDWSDLSELAKYDPVGAAGVATFTGCYFGVLIRHLEDDAEAYRVLTKLAGIFPRLYVELQHHNTDHEGITDADLIGWCSQLSKQTGIPPIATQDCHYCIASEGDLHTRMKMLAYGGADPGDVAFPGDSYHLSSESWMKRHFESDGFATEWSACLDSLDALCADNTLSIPTLDKYRYYVPGSFKSPQSTLETQTFAALTEAKVKNRTSYEDRLAYELMVIKSLSFADYFLLVADYTEYCRRKAIAFTARGSANGSLVCWLLGITSVDPIKWKLSFDRFLTLDRERPPDVDLDVEDTRREEVIDYLRTKYEVAQIGTYNRLGTNEETGRGSMFVSWVASRKRALPADVYKEGYSQVKSMHDLERVDSRVVDDLYKLSDMKLLKSPGAHPAGYVLSAPGLSIDDWMPMMLIPSSGSLVTQMTMDDVEDAGYVKIDLLGLRSLTTLRRVKEMVGADPDFEPPLSDSKVYTFLRRGNAQTGIFQLEGFTAAKGCRQMQVKNIHDLILVNALYRPAARDSGYTDMYIRRRRGEESITYPHEVFEPHLADTLGVPTFQEQVLAVLRDLGMDAVEMNNFLKAIKSKHGGDGSSELFNDNYDRFVGLCKIIGMTDKQVTKSWQMVEGFASYGFNRAHATAYSILGYKLAWFKVNHTLEFHAALLETTAGTVKEADYIKETRRCGVRILPPDVNISGATWTLDRTARGGAIRRGLVSIKGVGGAAADELWSCSPYISLDDLIDRCNSRAVTGGKNYQKDGSLTGTLNKLKEANALRSLGIDKETT